MDVAPRYTLLALFTLITLFILFILFKLLYTALTVVCTPLYVHIDREGWNGLRSCWAKSWVGECIEWIPLTPLTVMTTRHLSPAQRHKRPKGWVFPQKQLHRWCQKFGHQPSIQVQNLNQNQTPKSASKFSCNNTFFTKRTFWSSIDYIQST